MKSNFDPPLEIAKKTVLFALEEDLVPLGNISASMLDNKEAQAKLVSRQEGILAGSLCAVLSFGLVDESIECSFIKGDGSELKKGECFGYVKGPIGSILTAERTALNFLQHLSGVATLANAYVKLARQKSDKVKIIDTRKTIPGMRMLQKAAVRAGGANNHRGNLSDAIMIKDNFKPYVNLKSYVGALREMWPFRAIEIECDTLDDAREALKLGVDVIMCDNMEPTEVREVVKLVKAYNNKNVLVEVSGGITLGNVASYADTGCDLISVGSITHSPVALDIGLDIDAISN